MTDRLRVAEVGADHRTLNREVARRLGARVPVNGGMHALRVPAEPTRV